MTNKITVYSTKNCPRCQELKAALTSAAIRFEDADLADPANLAELRTEGVFTLEAPVLRVGNIFHTVNDLFAGGKLRNIEKLV